MCMRVWRGLARLSLCFFWPRLPPCLIAGKRKSPKARKPSGISLTLRRVYVYPVAVSAYQCQAIAANGGDGGQCAGLGI